MGEIIRERRTDYMIQEVGLKVLNYNMMGGGKTIELMGSYATQFKKGKNF